MVLSREARADSIFKSSLEFLGLGKIPWWGEEGANAEVERPVMRILGKNIQRHHDGFSVWKWWDVGLGCISKVELRDFV